MAEQLLLFSSVFKVTLVLSSAGRPGHSQPCITSHLVREPFQGAPASTLCPLSAARKAAKFPCVRKEEAERWIMLREEY